MWVGMTAACAREPHIAGYTQGAAQSHKTTHMSSVSTVEIPLPFVALP